MLTPGRRSGASDHAGEPGKRTRVHGLGPGRPLPAASRARFEQSLGQDLGGVRVHDGDAASEMASSVGARAFALGQDIAFAAGEYDPSSPTGERLLAHEVAHTAQQRGAEPPLDAPVATTQPGDAAETSADAAVGGMVAGRPIPRLDLFPQSIARKTAGEKDAAPRRGSLKSGLVGTFTAFEAGGQVTASVRKQQGLVRISSSEVRIRGTIQARPEVLEETFGTQEAPFGPATAGAIQNVVSSNRRGIYKRADGSIAGEHTGFTGRMHDQMTRADDKPGQATPYVGKDGGPWYQTPVTLDRTDQYKPDVKLVYDQPNFDLSLQVGDAYLAEVRGEDKFVTSIAARRDGETAYLASESWKVPWNLQLDPKTHAGAGGEVSHEATKDNATVVDGKLPVNEKDCYTFTSEAQALAAPREMLLETLKVQKTKDPQSYAYAVSAIRKLNWHFEVQVRCASKYGLIESDKMSLSIQGTRGLTRPLEMGRGDLRGVEFRFLDVFDPESFDNNKPIDLVLSGEGHSLSFKFWAPFHSGELAGGDEHYSVKVFG